MSHVAEQLAQVNANIAAAIKRSEAGNREVELIAVSKTFPVEAIKEASDAGSRTFGESRLQEAESKIDQLPSELIWHFIGRVQRNKVRRLIQRFSVIHGVDSHRLATYMDKVAAEEGLRPKIFFQVNLSGEASKGGFDPSDLKRQIESLWNLKNVEVLGLMTIPPVSENPTDSREWFKKLRTLRDELNIDHGIQLRGLSMGMSSDYEIAVEEGATHVRIGSMIFGERPNRVAGELG